MVKYSDTQRYGTQKGEINMNKLSDKSFEGKSVKILAIGNSFSVNAMRYLYDIMKGGGFEKILLGNLYIGGCSLETHANNAENNNPHYVYYRNDSGTWENSEKAVLGDVLRSEDWDIITFQQASYTSGIPSSYEPFLGKLLAYVSENKTNPKVKYAWHMTWAYQKGINHPAFVNYDSDQKKMYESITDTVKNCVLTRKEFSFLIPAGTAVQNARTSYMGDCFNADGTHLNALGEYLAGLTWYVSVTGKHIEALPYVPDDILLTETDMAVLIEAANNALDSMLSVSPSLYTENRTENNI